MRPIAMALALLAACGGAPTAQPGAPAMTSTPPTSTATPPARALSPGGSSDGVTCEQIRSEYVEEINVHGDNGPADLKAEDFGKILNQGTFLDTCQVPTTSHAEICAAVRAGVAVGVTVSLQPTDADLEVCVARQIRTIAFPSHPKTDFVTVRF